MNKLRTLLILVMGSLTIQSCCSKKETAASTATKQVTMPSNFEKEGFVKATVVNMTGLDGCGYMLQLEDNSKLEGLLKEEFKKDKLTVWVQYVPEKPGMASVCMAGKMVIITAIELRK